MTAEAAVRESLAAVAGAVLVSAERGRTGEAVERLRTAEGDVVLLLIESSLPPLDRAMLIGAIGPLAVERAPRTRIGAIDVAAAAHPRDVAAAARFLAGAGSTTGQVLIIGAEA